MRLQWTGGSTTNLLWLAVIAMVGINLDETAAMLFRRGRYMNGLLGEPNKHPTTLQRDQEPDDMWFEQPLDHFHKSEKRWQQRYFVNAELYRNDSTAPIFLMIGGEGEASKRWMHEGAWIKYAEHFGALCFQLEHRFYGKSHPTSDLSNSNLLFLTSEQALADIAAFVSGMKQKYNLQDTQKWIAFGGSYPGSLAAWVREKYPKLIHGSISSSGPLLAKVDFKEYFEVVKNSLASNSADCVDAVTKAFEQVEILLKHMIGQNNLDKKFKTCTPLKESIENSNDIMSFFESLADNFAGVVQYNNDNSPNSKKNINDLCVVMTNTTIGPQVARLAVVNEMLLNGTCLDYKYDKMIKSMQEITWNSHDVMSSARQWTYQTCNEFGFYQTSEHKNDLFGDRFGIDFFIKQCMDIFYEFMDPTFLDNVVKQTNDYYGALQPNTTNVLYVHGSIDPWHALGLTASKNPNTPTIYIQGTAHCANMYEPLANDPTELKAARNKITKYLAKLLDSYTLE